jgi:hypothetical protein
MIKISNFFLNQINNYKEKDLQSKGSISLKTSFLIGIHKGMITPTFPQNLIQLQKMYLLDLLEF